MPKIIETASQIADALDRRTATESSIRSEAGNVSTRAARDWRDRLRGWRTTGIGTRKKWRRARFSRSGT